MAYDPLTYFGAAPYYAVGRPPYSAELGATLSRVLGPSDGGRLLDVGCGPGVLTVELAPMFDEAVGLDPDTGMLAEGRRRADEHGIENIRWVEAVAEDIPLLGLGRFSVVTFGQSFHWTDQDRVAEAVYDVLVPGGAIVLIAHTVDGRPKPDGPDLPPIPHDDADALVEAFLGPRRPAGRGYRDPTHERYEDYLARTRFGRADVVFAPGRPDLVRDVDSVVAGYFSLSWAAPHLFGDRRDRFEAELRALLREHSPEGRFWDWPGDTELVIARR
jgi:SAM-dependent methyltransferase